MNVLSDSSNISSVEEYCPEGSEYCMSYNTAMSNATTSNDLLSPVPIESSELNRHNSMDRLMSLLNDMGHPQRIRSLSDSGQEDGIYFKTI